MSINPTLSLECISSGTGSRFRHIARAVSILIPPWKTSVAAHAAPFLGFVIGFSKNLSESSIGNEVASPRCPFGLSQVTYVASNVPCQGSPRLSQFLFNFNGPIYLFDDRDSSPRYNSCSQSIVSRMLIGSGRVSCSYDRAFRKSGSL